MKTIFLLAFAFLLHAEFAIAGVDLIAKADARRPVPLILEGVSEEGGESDYQFLEIRFFLKNTGTEVVSVATRYDVDSLNAQNTVSITRNAVAFDEVTLVKPSSTELGLVDLHPGEIAFIGLVREKILIDQGLPETIYVNFYCAEELQIFYSDLFVGELRETLSKDQIRHREVRNGG